MSANAVQRGGTSHEGMLCILHVANCRIAEPPHHVLSLKLHHHLTCRRWHLATELTIPQTSNLDIPRCLGPKICIRRLDGLKHACNLAGGGIDLHRDLTQSAVMQMCAIGACMSYRWEVIW